jgi:DNA polymerase I-like protein with 3'-5' exonuclease and polymerase domains
MSVNKDRMIQMAQEMFGAPSEHAGNEKTKSSPPRYTVLTPKQLPKQCEITYASDAEQVLQWCSRVLNRNSIVAFDVETSGLRPELEGHDVVGFSLASEGSAVYLHRLDGMERVFQYLVATQHRMIAHNLMFDGQWILHYYPELYSQVNWFRCTYLAAKLLATEGWAGQTWGLKDLQLELLGWEDTNEGELDDWLVGNGYVTGAVSTKFLSMTPEDKVAHYHSEDNLNTKGAKKIKPSKGDMHRAPAHILGHYCALDSHSTWLLYTEVLTEAERNYHALPDFLDKYMHLLHLLIKQARRGIKIDVDRLTDVLDEWNDKCRDTLREFFKHEEVRPHVRAYLREQMKEKYFDKEPAKLKKNGGVSKNWINWKARLRDAVMECRFNLNSNAQLCWLFYERLGYPIAKRTENGQASIDKKVIGKLGEPGKLLHRYNIVEKERQYIQSCLDVQHDGVLHPGFRVPGTLTGRLSGAGGVNVQQVPKVRPYLECYSARPGYKWVQCDVTALEKVVLTELSQCPALLSLYGPDARPGQDIYLFDGAHLPGFKEPLLEAGYDPFKSTEEETAEIKKKFKALRKKIKPASLGFGYGLGPTKYRADMEALGYSMSEDEAREVHTAYWNLYKGVKDYERELKRQHTKNRGWILNGIGRPLGIHQDYTHDIINRTSQSTGHDLLVYWVYIYSKMLADAGIEWHPIIVDFHDESIIEVEEGKAEQALTILIKAFEELNRLMNCSIPLTGEGIVCDNLAEVKIED